MGHGEREGIHSHRMLKSVFKPYGLATVDVVGTIVGSVIIWGILKHLGFNINLLIVMSVAFGCGIILHHIFGVKTTIELSLFH
jgi:hypothetical protein